MNTLGLSFEDAAELEHEARVASLGGKGAALVRMVSLGLPVPPGFTLTTAACHSFLELGWTEDLDAAVCGGLSALEATTGKRLGQPSRPLLVSVRSGAPVSMPGMMDTVLNAGMTENVAQALGAASGDATFGWDTHRRFTQSYASVVLGTPADALEAFSLECFGPHGGQDLAPNELASAALGLRTALANAGFVVPDDPLDQVRGAVQAVFQSWNCDRATVYRKVEGIDDALGTAATIQMMAFGNLSDRSGTGVAFSRDPSTGEPGPMGDFLQRAQGEDVVAGTHLTLPIAALGDLWPELAAELDRTASLLERDLRHIADIEFTIEDGAFWLLQVRRGKHSPRAALRMAIDMAEDPSFPLSRPEALERVKNILADPPTISSQADGALHGEVIATGLAASPGRAIGALCTDVDQAVEAEGRGEAVILVRRETSPADIAGMAAAKGIVTSRGGLVSHAAVVARGWGLPAVVGASDLDVLVDGVRVGETVIPTGTEITVDGTTGEILLGAHQADEIEVPEVDILRSWQRQANEDLVAAKGRFQEEATVDNTGRALAIKGMGDANTIAAVLGAEPGAVTVALEALVAAGDAQQMPQGRVRPTPDLTTRVEAWFMQEARKFGTRIDRHMESFHHVNADFKELVTDWQVRSFDDHQVPNDHTDASYDAEVLARLRTHIHAAIEPILISVAQTEPRLIRYLDRLENALRFVEAGDSEMVAHPLRDSYHTVWFELHEELIRLSGRTRAAEAAVGRA